MISTFAGAGLPVDLASIGRELRRLWEESGESKTRASLTNLMIYTDDPSTAQENTELLARIAGEHACRSILVLAEPNSPASRARAWIAAHCHHAGNAGAAKEICSEQITFHLEGDAVAGLPNLVFSHLDSDLPLVLLWRPPLPENPDPDFWLWVDRLIFDSGAWERPGENLDRLQSIASCRNKAGRNLRKAPLSDLNWTRLLGYRFAFASLFDHSAAQRQILKIERIRIRHAPGCRTAACLFAGWIAAQMRCGVHPDRSVHAIVSPVGREIRIDLEEAGAGAVLQLCEVSTKSASFLMHKEKPEDHFRLEMKGEGLPETQSIVGAAREQFVDTLLAELGRRGVHPLYFRALDLVRPLLG